MPAFIDKYVMYGIIVIILALLGIGSYLYWKHDITDAAQLQYDNAQLKQANADLQKQLAQEKALADAQNQTITDLNNQNSTLVNTTLKPVDTYLNDPATAKDDRPSSAILKSTIQKIEDLISPPKQ